MYFNFTGSKPVIIIKQIMFVVGVVIGALVIVDGFFAVAYMELLIKIGACTEAVGIFLIGKLGPDMDNSAGYEIVGDEDGMVSSNEPMEEVVQVVDEIGETADIEDICEDKE